MTKQQAIEIIEQADKGNATKEDFFKTRYEIVSETLDKYAESVNNSDIIGSVRDVLQLPSDTVDLIEIQSHYGERYTIEAIKGTSPDLRMLNPNQRVVFGDGDKYHFRLTKK